MKPDKTTTLPLLLSLALAGALVVACGDGGSSSGPVGDSSETLSSETGSSGRGSSASAPKNLTVETYDDLPSCDAEREGVRARVEDEDASYVCDVGYWTEISGGKSSGGRSSKKKSSSSSDPGSSSSSSSTSSSSSWDEELFAFGYALGNVHRPSAGCGQTSALRAVRQVENGAQFKMDVNGEDREFFITLPKNYDNTKPHKLLFAMHAMGDNGENLVHHSADSMYLSPYYGQQALDVDGDYIFVAPTGNSSGMPWSMNSDKDHKFIKQLITTLDENYCIDTSRVFMVGFSVGAMAVNSMAQDMQDRLRAVAVLAGADYNIYMPTNKGKPVAWMGVHGKNDGSCDYNRAKNSMLPRILKNNGKTDADGNFTDVSSEKPKEVGGSGHLCYDFQMVDERFPVKFCSWNGPHQWTAYDSGGWQNTWVPEAVHAFFEQF